MSGGTGIRIIKEVNAYVGRPRKRGFFRRLIDGLVRRFVNFVADAVSDDEFEEERFSAAEEKHIRDTVREQLKSSGHWINVDGIPLPRIGHIFRVKEETRYSIAEPGSLVFINEVLINKGLFIDPELAEVAALHLDSEGKLLEKSPLRFRVRDIEPVEQEQVFFDNWNKPTKQLEPFYDGEAVELAEDYRLAEESRQKAATIVLQKGLKGVIDEPKVQQGITLDEINKYWKQDKFRVAAQFILFCGSKMHFLEEVFFKVPLAKTEDLYHVYFPEKQNYLRVPRLCLKRRDFDKKMFDRVVMDDKTRQTILSLVHGKEEVLEKWGVKHAFQKGRGKIFLAIGPTGTGKTMMGEALAEYLEKPLYIIDLTNLGWEPKEFEGNLKDIIEKTERWNAVTIINEAELIIQTRDPRDSGSSMRIEAMLRNLESLQRGILWLTTNHPVKIDPAIEGRIRAQIYFPPLGEEERKKVWELSLPQNLPVPGFKEHLDELVAILLNGREIRNVINNAADQASKEGLDHVPAEYLLAWAKLIPENRKTLKKFKNDSSQYGPLGFVGDKF